MNLQEIQAHWQDWARRSGTDITATTKTQTIKYLEIDALSRAFRMAGHLPDHAFSVLEVGCGNGHNCVELARQWPQAQFTGVDYILEMTASASALSKAAGVEARTCFYTGNALELSQSTDLAASYDIVFSDRLIINMNTRELQRKTVIEMARKVAPGGLLMIIENFYDTYDQQNLCRTLVGLEPRKPMEFNLFMRGADLDQDAAGEGFEKISLENFGSLHDLILYVLVPSINGGVVDYSHPMVEKATSLSAAISAQTPNAFGAFGQNQLHVYRKR